MTTLAPSWPAWLRDIDALLAVQPFFVLSGNVRDRYLLPIDGFPVADDLAAALAAALAPAGFDVLLVHDPVDGYAVVGGDDEAAAWAAVHAATGHDLRSAAHQDLELLASVIDGVSRSPQRRIALVLDYAGHLIVHPERLEPTERSFFLACLKYSHSAEPCAGRDCERAALHNPVFWVVEREQELPAWFMAGNPALRHVPIPSPDLDDRSRAARLLLGAAAPHGLVAALASGTEGLTIGNLFDVLALGRDQGVATDDIEDAVRTFKVGAADSPWQKGTIGGRLRSIEIDDQVMDAEAFLSSRVLGQPQAITKATDILKRSVFGLSGAQAGGVSNRPRGVLFLAGPTGVGKTELAKAITQLVFGTEDAYIRFDMSEFSAEQAGDRLIGAPPGYVGFDAGGELTNAMRRRPHSLVLFDEVEKAHFRILDKFLQVLDEGRLTDARGTTVHFSEAIIVFTSNLGITVPARDGTDRRVEQVRPGDDFAIMEPKIRREILRHFTEELNRPELLNRVGDNVIVFDFIRPEVADRIFAGQVRHVLRRLAEGSGVEVVLEPEAAEALRRHVTADLSFGGRGVGNLLESTFVNPLARLLFERSAGPGDRLRVIGAEPSSDPPRLVLG